MELSPAETVALLHLRRRTIGEEIHARTSDLTKVLGYGPSRVKQIVASLIGKGMLQRVARGIYRFGETLVSALGGHSSGPDWYVYKPIAHDSSSEDASHPLLGAAPEMSESSGRTPMYDYEAEGDDLGGVGMVTPRKSLAERVKTSLKRKPRVPTAHREVPRKDWTMEFVAKEFRIRCKEIDPVTIETWRTRVVISPTGGNEMTMALKAWQAQYGITPLEALTLLDQFFADPKQTDKIDSQTPAYKHYLHYLKTHVDQLRMNTMTDDRMDRIKSQVLPWD